MKSWGSERSECVLCETLAFLAKLGVLLLNVPTRWPNDEKRAQTCGMANLTGVRRAFTAAALPAESSRFGTEIVKRRLDDGGDNDHRRTSGGEGGSCFVDFVTCNFLDRS